jgi:hypothetical protein
VNAAAVSGTLPEQLDPQAVYRAPRGRLCRVADVEYQNRRHKTGAVAYLEYLTPTGAPVATNMAESFSLGRENWWMLKVVG